MDQIRFTSMPHIRPTKVRIASAPLLDISMTLSHMQEIRGQRDKNVIVVGTIILARKLTAAESQFDKEGLRYVINGSMARNLLLISNGLLGFIKQMGDIDIIITGRKLREILSNLEAGVDELTELYPRFYFHELSDHERSAISPQIWMHDKVGSYIVIDRKKGIVDVCELTLGKDKFYVVAPWVLLANHVNHVFLDGDHGPYHEFEILLSLMLKTFDYQATVQLVAKTTLQSDEDLPIIRRKSAIKRFLDDVKMVRQELEELSERPAVSS